METLLAHCSTIFHQHSWFFAAFFLGGLSGGFTHCLAMCGPVVAGQSACGGCSNRVASGLQYSYHLGRLTTYSALGFLAALVARHIAAYSFWPYLSSLLLVIAGGMFIFSSLPIARAHSLCKVNARSNYTRGLLMGFMPCGLLYAALMMAATLTNPLSGMVAMAVFTLGTMPALMMASGLVQIFNRSWQPAIQQVGRAAMVFNGLSLVVMAGKLVE